MMYLTFSLEFYLPVGVEVEFLRLVNLQIKWNHVPLQIICEDLSFANSFCLLSLGRIFDT